MTEPQKWVGYYHNRQPHDIPVPFPNRDQLFLLQDVFHERNGPFQRLISWAGIRYMVVMEPNMRHKHCLENDLLEKIFKACEEKNGVRRRALFQPILRNCMTGLWSYLEKDLAQRQQKGTLMKPIGFLDYDRNEVHKLQFKTIDGTVHAIASEAEDETRFRPVENTFPGVPCFPVSEIEVLERITQLVFRVKIRGQEYCLKAGHENFVCAVEKLRRTGSKISNVLCLKGLAVDRNSKVIGMVTDFVSGKLLILVLSATAQEKDAWKKQISTAVRSLHQNDVVWGDAKPHNIIISNISGEAVLIDLDGGATDGWVDEELCDTVEGDLQALKRILRFIDNLPTHTN